MNVDAASNFNEGAGATLEHASFPHLSVFEWEALHRLAAVSGEVVIKTLLTAGSEMTADSHVNA
ncbi:hypothetical protein L914_02609, partial [Phytophthora nicotianae]